MQNGFAKADVRRCFFKKVFLKTSQYLHESTCGRVFFNKAAGQHRCFPVNIAKFLIFL